MKKIISILIIFALLIVVSGCADSKIIDGKLYETYGLIDKDDYRDSCVKYDVSIGNIILSVIFFEIIAVPIWLLGFNTHEPVDKICED